MSDERQNVGSVTSLCEDSPDAQLVGKGRSGKVYLDRDARGRSIARKIFCGEWLSAFVVYLLTGAANPYSWSRAAVRCAVIRKRIIQILVRYWFADKLRIPHALGFSWNSHFRVFELRSEFVRGRHVALQHSFRKRKNDAFRELTREIMKPLQSHLIDSGLDGMLWQAGYGNPVAGSNFMLHERRDGTRTWSWIDTESGVPALFPLNLWRLVSFYIPRSIFHGRPLFDDVDTSKLASYVAEHNEQLKMRLGGETVAKLNRLVDRLEEHQNAWKSLDRTQRGIACFVAQQRLTSEEADWYRSHPWRWHLYVTRTVLQNTTQQLTRMIIQFTKRCFGVAVENATSQHRRFIVSARQRQATSRQFVSEQIDRWSQRKLLTREQSKKLHAELQVEPAGMGITDYGVHLALKPFTRFVQFCVVPLMFLMGFLSPAACLLLLVAAGAITRAFYTLPKCLYAQLHGEGRPPWLALLVGMLPFVGSAAYAVQRVAWATDRTRRLPQFLLYDTFARLGRAIPIWGGADSLLEVWANRLPDWLLQRRSPNVRPPS